MVANPLPKPCIRLTMPVSKGLNAAKRNESEKDDNWTYVPWVVSFAEKFSDEALKLAKENGVTLVNGEEFCRMLLNAGVGAR